MERSKLFLQIIKFGIVGFVCFLIDFGLLHFLTEIFKLHYLISAAVAFSVSVIVNYFLSMKFVFENKKDRSGKANFVFFLISSIIGLILTELIMHIGVDKMSISYTITKLFATAFVMIFNFIVRKIIYE